MDRYRILTCAAAFFVGTIACSEKYDDPYAQVPPVAQSQPEAPANAAAGAPGAAPTSGGTGAPASAPQPGAPVTPANQIKVTGVLTVPADAPAGSVQIDANASGGGLSNAPLFSNRMPAAGPFTLYLPKKSGSVSLMIYLGVSGNDPGKVAPNNIYSWGPIEVGTDDLANVNIDLSNPAVQAASRTTLTPGGTGVPTGQPSDGAPPPAQAPGTGEPGAAATAPTGSTAPAATSPAGAALAPGVYAPTAPTSK